MNRLSQVFQPLASKAFHKAKDAKLLWKENQIIFGWNDWGSVYMKPSHQVSELIRLPRWLPAVYRNENHPAWCVYMGKMSISVAEISVAPAKPWFSLFAFKFNKIDL